MQLVLEWCARLSGWRVWAAGAIGAVIFEAFTILFRFGLGLQSTVETGFLARFTFGIRIHHGYIGVVMMIVGWTCMGPGGLRNLLYIVGSALVLSDLAHHFLVLWPITGSPEFHLTYPPKDK